MHLWSQGKAEQGSAFARKVSVHVCSWELSLLWSSAGQGAEQSLRYKHIYVLQPKEAKLQCAKATYLLLMTIALLCNQPENYLRQPYFASLDVKNKNSVYSSETEKGRSSCWKYFILKLAWWGKEGAEEYYRINVPDLVRHKTSRKLISLFKESCLQDCKPWRPIPLVCGWH